MTVWYSVFKAALVRPVMSRWFRVKIEGTEKIPANGCILAANHLDAGDTLALPSMVKPKMVFPAKKELFLGKSLKGRFVAWFLRAVGQAPIDRTGGRSSAASLGSIEDILIAGGVVGIFPEGTRSPDGNLYKGKTGVARMSLATGKPVLPVGLIDTRFVKSRLGIPTMRNPRIVIGDPMDFRDWAGQDNDHKVLRWVTNEVMGAIQQITGQAYVDVYASRVKRGDLKDKPLDEYTLAHPNQGQPTPTRTVDLEVPEG